MSYVRTNLGLFFRSFTMGKRTVEEKAYWKGKKSYRKKSKNPIPASKSSRVVNPTESSTWAVLNPRNTVSLLPAKFSLSRVGAKNKIKGS